MQLAKAYALRSTLFILALAFFAIPFKQNSFAASSDVIQLCLEGNEETCIDEQPLNQDPLWDHVMYTFLIGDPWDNPENMEVYWYINSTYQDEVFCYINGQIDLLERAPSREEKSVKLIKIPVNEIMQQGYFHPTLECYSDYTDQWVNFYIEYPFVLNQTQVHGNNVKTTIIALNKSACVTKNPNYPWLELKPGEVYDSFKSIEYGNPNYECFDRSFRPYQLANGYQTLY